MISTGSTDILNGSGYGGFGGGGWGGIAPIGLFGVANGLFGQGDKRCEGNDVSGQLGQAIYGSTVLSKLGDIEGAIPLASLQTQNSILEQTAALTSQINQVGLAQLAATTGVKDAIQNTGLVLLQATNNEGEQTRSLITQLNTDNLNRLLTVADLDRRDERSFARTREVEVNVTQNVTQAQAQLQAQAQQQAQFSALFAGLNALVGDIQAVKQGQVIFNSGTMAASGTQAAANTKVN